MIPLCLDLGVGVIPWSPLARGRLAVSRWSAKEQVMTLRAGSDNFANELYDNCELAVIDATNELAAERQLPTAQIAPAWLLQQPGVTAPIVGATKPAHVNDAAAALDVELSGDEMRRLEAAYRPHQIRGHA
jgi:aryl-alcohol dehydrogenase-like predicted oxidoreductase